MATTVIGEVAAGYYLDRWVILRDEALKLSIEARRAGPLLAHRLRNQAALVDDYAVILHHAAWRELHPDEPDGRRVDG